MTAVCGYQRDRETGQRYYVPECWGGLYDISGCYCERPESDPPVVNALPAEIAERLCRLEAAIEKILASLSPEIAA